MGLVLDEQGRIDYEQVDINSLTPMEQETLDRQLIDDGLLDPVGTEFDPEETSRSVVGNTARFFPGEVVDAGITTAKSFGSSLSRIAADGLGLGASVSRQLEKVSDKIVKFSDETLGVQIPRFRTKPLGPLEDSLEEASVQLKRLQNFILPEEERRELLKGSLIPKNPKDLDDLSKSTEKFQVMFSEGLASLVPMLVGGGLIGKAGTVSTSYFLNASSNFQDLQGAGFSEKEALTRSMIMAIPQSMLDSLLPEKVLKGGQFNKAVNVVWGAVQEGGTEGLQQMISILGRLEDPRELDKFVGALNEGGGWEEVFEAFVVRGAIGGSVGFGTGQIDKFKISQDIQDQIIRKTKEVKQLKILSKSKVTEPDTTDPVSNPFPSSETNEGAQDLSIGEPRDIEGDARALANRIVDATTNPDRVPGTPGDFNTNNFRTTDDVKVTIDVMSEVVRERGLIDPSVLKVQKLKEVQDGSKKQQEEILKAFEKGTGLATSGLLRDIRETSLSTSDLNQKLVTYRALEVSTLEQMNTLAEKIELGNATDQDLIKFVALEDFSVSFQPDLKSIQTNVARALTSYNIQVDGTTKLDIRNNIPKNNQAAKDTISGLLEIDNTRDGIIRRAKALRKLKTNKAKIKRIRKDNKQSPLSKAFLEYAQATWLGNVFNRSVEFIGPAIVKTSEMVEDIVTFGVGTVDPRNNIERMSKRELKVRIGLDQLSLAEVSRRIQQIPMTFKEGLSTIKGLTKEFKKQGFIGIEEHLEKRSNLIKGREVIEGPIGKSKAISRQNLEKSRLVNSSVSMIGKLGDLAIQRVRGKSPDQYSFTDSLWWAIDQGGALYRLHGFGFMQVFDPIFENMAFKRESQGLIHREAWRRVDEGTLSEPNVPEFISESSKKLEDIRAGKTIKFESQDTKEFIEGLFEVSKGKASEATFKEKLEGAPGSSSSLSNFAGAIDQHILKRFPLFKTLSFPFFTTAVNIARFSIRRTPLLQGISSQYRANLTGVNGQIGQHRAAAQFLMGSVMMGFFYALWYNDKLIGSFPKGERETRKKAKLLENSFGIPFSEDGESFYQFTRLEPIASLAKMSADVFDIIALGNRDETTNEELKSALFMGLANNFFNKTTPLTCTICSGPLTMILGSMGRS